VADPEFYNGGPIIKFWIRMGAEGRGEGFEEGAVPPPQKKMNFYLN